MRSSVRALAVVAAATLVVGLGPGGAGGAAAPRTASTVTISSTPLAGVPTVARGLIGGALRWYYEEDGSLAIGPGSRSVRAAARAIGVGSVRYAGGTIANLWNYANDVDTPGCQVSGGAHPAQYSSIPAAENGYTIAEHAAFLKDIHSGTNLMIPMIGTTPAQAKQFVLTVARRTGATRLTVEIGNEPYYPQEHYWRSMTRSVRLHEYVDGGGQVQGPPAADQASADQGWNGLYALTGCNLRTTVRANGHANQAYRTRFRPILHDPKLIIDVGADHTRWHYRASLRNCHPRRAVTACGPGDHVFTISGDGMRIYFGNTRPSGPMRIDPGHDYKVVDQPGFVDFYKAIKSLQHTTRLTRVDVCSSWDDPRFVKTMATERHPYDCIAVHTYMNETKAQPGPANAEMQSYAVQRTAHLRDIRQLMKSQSAPGARTRFLIVTEYGVLARRLPDLGNKFVNTLYLARLVQGQIRNGVRVGNLSNFGSLFRPVRSGGTTTYVRSSSGWMMSYVHKLVGLQPVQVHGTVPSGIDVLGMRGTNTRGLFVVSFAPAQAWTPSLPPTTDFAGGGCIHILRMAAPPGGNELPQGPSEQPPSVRAPVAVNWPAGTSFPAHARVQVPVHAVEVLTVTRGACA